MALETMSEQSSPDVITQAEQEPFPEGILGGLGPYKVSVRGKAGNQGDEADQD